MLLKNYFQLLSDISQLYPDSQAIAITFSTPIKNLVGTTLTLKYDPYRDRQSISTTLPNTFSNCIIGSSDDPSNFDDYCLKSQITNFSASFITTIPSEIKDGHERFTILIFGKVTEACIVREIGLTKKLSTLSDGIQECLMLRHVLDIPIELQAGDSLGITISYEA